MSTTETEPRTQRWSSVIVGSIIVVAGVLLLLDTTGVLETGDLVRFLPSLVVVWGLYRVVGSGFREWFGPLVLVAGGAVWQLLWLDLLTWTQVWQLWPLLVVIAGVSLVLGARRRRTVRVDGDEFTALGLFAEVDRDVVGETRSGSAVAAFGETRLDLRDGVRPPATVDVVAILGEVELRVPSDWTVDLDAVNLLGDVRDRRRRVPRDPDVDLHVSGVTMLGEVTIVD